VKKLGHRKSLRQPSAVGEIFRRVIKPVSGVRPPHLPGKSLYIGLDEFPIAANTSTQASFLIPGRKLPELELELALDCSMNAGHAIWRMPECPSLKAYERRLG
jgi:hypothetical protein